MCVDTWQLDGCVAKLAIAGGAIAVDVARPSGGLSFHRESASVGESAKILGVVLGDREPFDAASLDAFVRGRDLVATYAEHPPRRVRAQIYWRILSPGEFALGHEPSIAGAFDLILSVNTSLLDDDPLSTVRSTITAAAEILKVPAAPGCFVVRTGEKGLSYVEMVHPADYQQSEALIEGSALLHAQLTHELFARRLEKGVILRARVRAGFVARHADQTIALAAFRQFAAAEPPLTV